MHDCWVSLQLTQPTDSIADSLFLKILKMYLMCLFGVVMLRGFVVADMAEKELANLSNIGFNLCELFIYVVFLLV